MDIKLLLDANISWKLTGILSPVFGGCFHVDDIGLQVPVQDADIWSYALKNDCVIVTKDNDFADLLDLRGFPPKVVLLRAGNNSNKALAELLVRHKSAIEDLVKGDYGLLEIVTSPGETVISETRQAAGRGSAVTTAQAPGVTLSRIRE